MVSTFVNIYTVVNSCLIICEILIEFIILLNKNSLQNHKISEFKQNTSAQPKLFKDVLNNFLETIKTIPEHILLLVLYINFKVEPTPECCSLPSQFPGCHT